MCHAAFGALMGLFWVSGIERWRKEMDGGQRMHPCWADEPPAHRAQAPILGFCFPIATAAPAAQGWLCTLGTLDVAMATCKTPWDSLKNCFHVVL